MFKTILVPTDGSALSEAAIHSAVELAKLTSGKIIAVSVAEPYPYSPLAENAFGPDINQYESQMRAFAQQHVQKIADVAAAENVPCTVHVVLSFSPYEEIIKAAKEFHCDVVFMASHGRKGLNKLFIGSETQKVLAHSTIPVMVFR